MNVVRGCFVPLLCAWSVAATAEPTPYQLDTTHSAIVFFVEHDGYSRSVGRLKLRAGTLAFDDDAPERSSVRATIDIGSLDMGDAAWNRTMGGRAWFNAEKYPTAEFVSESVRQLDSGDYEISGALTLADSVVQVVLTARLNKRGNNLFAGGKEWIGFSATATLDRHAAGLSGGGKAVGDAVEMVIEVEAGRVTPPRRPRRR